MIFVGSINNEKGMQRSRRLFSTLNRYAKPVTMDDIIALDEDDSIAIITRNLLENFDLFSNNRVTKSKNKAIADKDKESITSIITLYQCNREMLKVFRKKRKKESPNKNRDKMSLKDYLKFRPDEKEIKLFENFCGEFCNAFKHEFKEVKDYLRKSIEKEKQPALQYRNSEDGGNLLFRPVGLLPFVQAVLEISNRTQESFNETFKNLKTREFYISKIPWKHVLWNPNEKTMIMGNQVIVKLFFLYFYKNVIKDWEIESLKKKYADRITLEEENIEEILLKLK